LSFRRPVGLRLCELSQRTVVPFFAAGVGMHLATFDLTAGALTMERPRVFGDVRPVEPLAMIHFACIDAM
jgi:hypothetical protein